MNDSACSCLLPSVLRVFGELLGCCLEVSEISVSIEGKVLRVQWPVWLQTVILLRMLFLAAATELQQRQRGDDDSKMRSNARKWLWLTGYCRHCQLAESV
eukprot:scpid108423/ scgid8657/ 